MPLKKRSILISGHATSVTMEPEFWDALKTIASKNQKSINSLIAEIDSERGDNNLSSAIRVYVLNKILMSSRT
jgi:predicted DNA-binding ribbon-helix-helix protein